MRPKGTFYLFPGIEKTGLTDDEFCNVLLDKGGQFYINDFTINK